jgi:hypothetical protein
LRALSAARRNADSTLTKSAAYYLLRHIVITSGSSNPHPLHSHVRIQQTQENELDPITDTAPLPNKADVMATAKFTAMLHSIDILSRLTRLFQTILSSCQL